MCIKRHFITFHSIVIVKFHCLTLRNDQYMNAGSNAMPGPSGPSEPPDQPECCPTPFVTSFDSSGNIPI